MRIPVAALLIASPFAFAFAGSSVALAQNCVGGGGGGTYGGYDPTPNETVTVSAPRFQTDHARLNTPPGRTTMSKTVSLADLNLCTPAGRHAARDRVAATSAEICSQLATLYPHGLPSDTSCYRDSRANAQPKTDWVIGTARGTR